MMTRCAYVESRLRALVDGELDPGDNRKVLAHIDHCVHCRRAHARVLRLAGLLQEQEFEDVPAHFSANLQVRLARHRREREARAAAPHWLSRLAGAVPRIPREWRLAGGVTAAVTAAVCLFAFTRGIQAEEVARLAGQRWSRIRNYGCVFVSQGVYQGQPRVFRQSQFFRRPNEFRLETTQDYPLTTFVYRDRVIHFLPGGEWDGHKPLVIVRPRKVGEDALPFPFGVTWQNGGNVSLDQLIRQLAQNDKSARVVGEEKVGDRDCYRLAFSAVPPGGTLRDRYELWIDKESFLPRRVSWFRDAQNHITTEAQQLQVNYDVIPAGTFDFRIPENAAVVLGDVDPHVLALPILRLRGVTYAGDPVGSARIEGWSRVSSVPFPVQSPDWLPAGFELVRMRRRIGRWVDLHWIRKGPDGKYETIKLVEQDGAADAEEPPAGREVRVGRSLARLTERRVPYAYVRMTWRSGGTSFQLTATGIDADEAIRIGASMEPVRAPVSRVAAAEAAQALPAPGEPSEIPGEALGQAMQEPRSLAPVRIELPQAPEPSVEAHQPPMMPEMADDEPPAPELVGPVR